jgi:SAM-dependent methyltransferase
MTAPPSISNVMFRSGAVQDVGGFEEKFPEMYDSQTLMAKMYINFDTFIADCCWVSKREYQDEIPQPEQKVNQGVTELDYLRWLASYISEKERNDQSLNKVLRDRIWGLENPTLHKYHEFNKKNIGAIKKTLKPVVRRAIPISIRHYLLSKLRGALYQPPLGWVHFGELRRLKPISNEWGVDRGLPIDRYYIEKFLAKHTGDIRGNVVEVGGGIYTNKFGSTHIATKDILCLEKGEVPNTTIVADLTNAPQIPSDSFNCIIIVQTLQLIYNLHYVIDTLYRILKPGGVVLATVSGISQTTDDEPWDRNWCWGFTSLSARKLFEEKFPPENVEVTGYGNVLVAASFLYGLATEDLTEEELDYYDSRYEITISVRAVKPD